MNKFLLILTTSALATQILAINAKPISQSLHLNAKNIDSPRIEQNQLKQDSLGAPAPAQYTPDFNQSAYEHSYSSYSSEWNGEDYYAYYADDAFDIPSSIAAYANFGYKVQLSEISVRYLKWSYEWWMQNHPSSGKLVGAAMLSYLFSGSEDYETPYSNGWIFGAGHKDYISDDMNSTEKLILQNTMTIGGNYTESFRNIVFAASENDEPLFFRFYTGYADAFHIGMIGWWEVTNPPHQQRMVSPYFEIRGPFG